MKKLSFIITAIFICMSAVAQNYNGTWNGVLNIQGSKLRLVFNITQAADSISATMDSPDQGGKGMPVTKITVAEDSTLKIEIPRIQLMYTGKITPEDEIKGLFQQGFLVVPMKLSRDEARYEAAKRPQNPLKPYPYKEEEVTVYNKRDSVKLAGTLTLPSGGGKSPAVVLITGSGTQNRDEEIMEHKPFLVWADHLTRNGIAVLRMDDRGCGGSTGNPSTSTSLDFARDISSAVEYLRTRPEIDPRKIGLIGHSEGGLIAPIVAADDKKMAFIVMLAGPGIPGDSILLLQARLIGEASGMSSEQLTTARNINREVYRLAKEGASEQQLTDFMMAAVPGNTLESAKKDTRTITSPWFRTFLAYDPAPTLSKVRCAVLAVNGTKDLQVPYRENLDAIAAALKSNCTTHAFDNLNHLFQNCTTGAPNEYATIEETVSPTVLQYVTQWIIAR